MNLTIRKSAVFFRLEQDAPWSLKSPLTIPLRTPMHDLHLWLWCQGRVPFNNVTRHRRVLFYIESVNDLPCSLPLSWFILLSLFLCYVCLQLFDLSLWSRLWWTTINIEDSVKIWAKSYGRLSTWYLPSILF